MKKFFLATVASSALMASAISVAHAADATWVGGTPAPAGGNGYGTSTNWTPAGPPPDGTAIFGASANTDVFVASNFAVGGWTFNSGAAYAFTINGVFDFGGAGITINGGSATITNESLLQFFGTSTAGSATIINNNSLQFFNTSTAGNAAIVNNDPSAVTDFSSTTGPNGDRKLSAGSIAGSGRFFLGANELTVGGNNKATMLLPGVISDCGASGTDCNRIGATGGSLVKVGIGELALGGVNTYTGATTVDEGVLSVSGSIAASSLTTVNAGGTLTGDGTVGNTTINAGGIFSPGFASPGASMTVAGNLAFQSGAQYRVGLDPATSSFVNVTGTATLGGATVRAIFAPGTYVTRQYTILEAGGVSGTFGQLVISNLSPMFTAALSYDGAHKVFLDVSAGGGGGTGSGACPSGFNVNQCNVGRGLQNSLNTVGRIPAVFATLTQAGHTQVSGETAVGTQQTTFDAMTQFMGVMTDPLLGGRGDGAFPGSGATSFAEEGNAGASDGRKRTGSERDAYGMITKADAARNNLFDPRWSVWAAGFGGSQTTDGNAALGSNATTSRLGATAVGADYWFSPNTIAGFALAGGGTSFSVANGGSGRSDLFQAGAFIRHTVGAAYVSAKLCKKPLQIAHLAIPTHT